MTKSTIDSDAPVQCEWDDCDLIFEDGEQLYRHLTSVHIGRKSAGTLILHCGWRGCSAKAGKRDHLTSHARVHTPLKPHACPICTKTFKRPQDLKKHERIHTAEHHELHKHSKAITVVDGKLIDNRTASKPTKIVPVVAAPRPRTSSSITPVDDRRDSVSYPAPAPEHLPNVAQYQHQPFSYSNYGAPHQQYATTYYPPELDLAAIVAHQQHLTAEATASAAYALGAPSISYAPYQQPQQHHMPPQSHQYYPPPAAYNAPTYPQYGYGAPPPRTQHDAHSYPTPSLYPTMPSSSSLYPSIHRTLDDQASPESSHTHSVPHSASQSPRLPGLSPPSGSFSSASPEQSSDVSDRRSFSGNAHAGSKRAFQDAAGEFMGDLKNKRFQDYDSIGPQLDALSTFLLPTEQDVKPIIPHDRSSIGSGSDYSRAEVDTLNNLLVSLGQNIEAPFPPAYSYDHLENQHRQHVEMNQQTSHYSPSFGALYPALTHVDRQFAPVPMRASQMHYGPDDLSSFSHKVASPPTIAPMNVRIPTYRKIDRLSRAAPMSFTREPESMSLDDSAEIDQGYSSSIRSTSLDTTPSSSCTSSVSPRSHDAYPYAKKLPPMRSASLGKLDPGTKLPPISAILAAAALTSLPSIHHLLTTDPAPHHPTVSTSQIDSSKSDSIQSSDSDTSRPGSAHESSTTVERLTHRVHKLDMRADESDAESSSDDMKEEEPKLKKTRIASPAPEVVEDVRTTVEREVKERRIMVLRALIVHLNSTFRLQVVKKVAAG